MTAEPTLPELLEHALHAAVLAPSPHNTQPWRFVVDGDRIEGWLDRERVLSVADPDAREARLSCGAAVFNLAVTLRAAGRGADVGVLPDHAEKDLLAVVETGRDWRAAAPERALAAAVRRRHTNRRPFFDRPVSFRIRTALSAAALQSGATLDLIDGTGRYDMIAELIRRAEHIQSVDERYAAETAQWTGRPAEAADGVPRGAAGPPPERDGVIAMRRFTGGDDLPPREFEQQPLLAALLTPGRGARADVQAGMAMQHVLLAATTFELSVSFLSQPFEVAGTRAALGELFRGRGEVHTLLRIGYGTAAGATPRRALAEVVDVKTLPRR
ncbi:hypothetical protein FPZ12_025155 [Amycolatopsis acidicola]|uniref:Nitroreductase domain-containing protein n=1 Tax=Amycolatopsis acidicola TaxID=2596893 RepID=A0A5N0UX58_9PSEU|nr:nitroreductase family protein [Amycolatopsis acidicola]KAA9157461.1 hypothetical protein FPZ12_025155 [Amycolatopsis acidicola]